MLQRTPNISITMLFIYHLSCTRHFTHTVIVKIKLDNPYIWCLINNRLMLLYYLSLTVIYYLTFYTWRHWASEKLEWPDIKSKVKVLNNNYLSLNPSFFSIVYCLSVKRKGARKKRKKEEREEGREGEKEEGREKK